MRFIGPAGVGIRCYWGEGEKLYDWVVDSQYFDTDKLTAAVVAGCRTARLETLAAGVPVFYLDSDGKTDVMEMPDGKKFEIRYILGAPGDRNYEVVGQLVRPAA